MPRKRKFIVYVAISADGFIARKDGSVDWLIPSAAQGELRHGCFLPLD
jgi:hypothetical protein